jgi:hypothetical protein
MVANNAGMPATPADLINVDEVIGKYYDVVPDPNVPEQRVSFGTSGHRGSSLKTSFNEAHIVAITQAIAEYRKKAGVTGPLYIGRDTHALSEPAWKTAIEVLVANGVTVRIDSRDDFTPTPVVSQAILTHNRAADGTQRFTGEGLADGIVVTPSHNPPTDGGFKYDPVTGGPSTCCESFYDAALIDRAYRLLHSFGFTGMAMVEFKGDCLLEVNPRVWGSFPMTEAAQSPFTAHYARAAAGERVTYAAQDYRPGVRMRFLLNDTLAALHYLRAGRIGVFLRSIADLFTAKEALRCRGDNRVFWVYLKNSLFARG